MNMKNIIDGSRVVVRGPHFVPRAVWKLLLEDYHCLIIYETNLGIKFQSARSGPSIALH